MDAQLAVKLRSYVEEWLATGIREDGSETPFERSLGRAPEAFLAVTTHLERFPAYLGFLLDSGELSVSLAEIGSLPPPSGNPYYDVALDATRLFAGLMACDWKHRLAKCRHCKRY
jgi:hypothetical protein